MKATKLIMYLVQAFVLMGIASTVQSKPPQFNFNQSTIQAFYFIKEATILGDNISKDDWIAAFNDTICVGSRKWNGKFTDIPAMGSNNSTYSAGYLMPEEIPIFKIYDKSENLVYLAKTNTIHPFGKGMAQIFHIDSMYVDFDCNGVLGGHKKLDKCGICNGNGTECTKSNNQDQ